MPPTRMLPLVIAATAAMVPACGGSGRSPFEPAAGASGTVGASGTGASGTAGASGAGVAGQSGDAGGAAGASGTAGMSSAAGAGGTAGASGIAGASGAGAGGLPAGWLYASGNKLRVSDGRGAGPVWVGRGVNLDDVFLGFDNVAYEVHGYPPSAGSYTYANLPVVLGEYGSLDSGSAPGFYADLEAKQIPNLAWDFEPFSNCAPDLLNVTWDAASLVPSSWGSIVKGYLTAHAP